MALRHAVVSRIKEGVCPADQRTEEPVPSLPKFEERPGEDTEAIQKAGRPDRKAHTPPRYGPVSAKPAGVRHAVGGTRHGHADDLHHDRTDVVPLARLPRPLVSVLLAGMANHLLT